MKLKEKEKSVSAAPENAVKTRKISLPAEIVVSVLLGYLSAGTALGGRGIPLCVSAASLFSPIGGIGVYAGMMSRLFAAGELNAAVTEITAVPAVVISGASASVIAGKRLSPAAKGILSGAAYFICGTAAALVFKVSAALIFAVAFRGMISGAASFLAAKVIDGAENGTAFSRENRFALSAVYTLAICILCGISFGTVNAGRAAGAFIALSAAYRLGSGTGGGTAALTAFAAGTASSALLPSSPILICSALSAGMFRRKSRLAAAASFLGAGAAGALIYGMPADAMKLLADISIAAVIFCIVPESVFNKAMINIRADQGSAVPAAQYEKRLRFASEAVSDIRNSFIQAVDILNVRRTHSAAASGLDEIAAEYLECAAQAFAELSGTAEKFCRCDEELSENINEIISSFGAKNARTAVFSDKPGRVYIECFYEGMLNVRPDAAAAALSSASGRELALPEPAYFGRTTRLCFHEQENFKAEIGISCAGGREKLSGDRGTVFRDGLGSLCIILSDGMGSGPEAAVESCMTVSIASRMMKAGFGTEAAVRLTNLLLMSKSAEESFSTIDILTVDLFSGRTVLVKLGAAQSLIKCGGNVKTVESRTTPVGMISPADIDRRTFRLSDGDEAVMMTDGICEEVFPEIRELMLSTGVTAQDLAERIICAAEKDKENNIFRQDDKTVYTVKLHKI